VLQPLAEIAPDVRHPISGLSPSQMMAQANDPSTVKKI
jgi:7,8-dihydro-6-hydroxymethylpterin-pyrophosphokinase